jgi:hypothetical protein
VPTLDPDEPTSPIRTSTPFAADVVVRNPPPEPPSLAAASEGEPMANPPAAHPPAERCPHCGGPMPSSAINAPSPPHDGTPLGRLRAVALRREVRTVAPWFVAGVSFIAAIIGWSRSGSSPSSDTVAPSASSDTVQAAAEPSATAGAGDPTSARPAPAPKVASTTARPKAKAAPKSTAKTEPIGAKKK